MRILHRLVRVLVLALLLALGLWMLVAAWSQRLWGDVLAAMQASRAEVAFAGIAVVCLGLLFCLTGLRRKRREKFLSFTNDGGAVSVSTQAMADFVAKLAAEFPSIVRMRPRILPRKGQIDIIVELRVRAGPQIHEVCEMLQQRIRESVTTGLGISQVRNVEVSVREIISEHKPAAA
jgi:uncharacterized alkaline shock family protein YloU